MYDFGKRKKGGNAPTVLPKGSRQDRTSAPFIRSKTLNVNECEIGAIFNAIAEVIPGVQKWGITNGSPESKMGASKQSYHDWQRARIAAEGVGE